MSQSLADEDRLNYEIYRGTVEYLYICRVPFLLRLFTLATTSVGRGCHTRKAPYSACLLMGVSVQVMEQESGKSNYSSVTEGKEFGILRTVTEGGCVV
jgi:hypothetical protein